jgi:chromosome segregation ATPase
MKLTDIIQHPADAKKRVAELENEIARLNEVKDKIYKAYCDSTAQLAERDEIITKHAENCDACEEEIARYGDALVEINSAASGVPYINSAWLIATVTRALLGEGGEG